MKLLKLIGYWTEPGSVFPYPHPKDFVVPNWHPDLREKLVQYLRDGAIYTADVDHNYWVRWAENYKNGIAT